MESDPTPVVESIMMRAADAVAMPLVDGFEDRVDRSLSAKLRMRYPIDDRGLILDSENGHEPVWVTSIDLFEAWFLKLEEIVGQPLGRRLAHAAEAHESWRLIRKITHDPMPKPMFGRMNARLAWINADWRMRGCGRLVEAELDSAKVEDCRLSCLGAGQTSAVMAQISGQGNRYRWQDDGPDQTLISMDQSSLLPVVNDLVNGWQEVSASGSSNEPHPFSEVEADDGEGRWSVMGIPRTVISRDLLRRLAEHVRPHLEAATNSDQAFDWQGLEESKAWVWQAMAEAIRLCFLNSEEHVLIADVRHWDGVIEGILASEGLGRSNAITSLGEDGAVEITLAASAHPALSAGLLAAAWERSVGRRARCSWQCGPEGHVLRLESLRNIAAASVP